MAVIASGGTFRRQKCDIPASERRTLNVEDLWGAWLLRVVARPCDCRAPLTLSRLRFKEITAYLRHPRSAALPLEMRMDKASLPTSSMTTSWKRGIGHSIALLPGSNLWSLGGPAVVTFMKREAASAPAY